VASARRKRSGRSAPRAVLILAAYPRRPAAERAAKLLVRERVLACATVAPGARAFYTWRGASSAREHAPLRQDNGGARGGRRPSDPRDPSRRGPRDPRPRDRGRESGIPRLGRRGGGPEMTSKRQARPAASRETAGSSTGPILDARRAGPRPASRAPAAQAPPAPPATATQKPFWCAGERMKRWERSRAFAPFRARPVQRVDLRRREHAHAGFVDAHIHLLTWIRSVSDVWLAAQTPAGSRRRSARPAPRHGTPIDHDPRVGSP